MQTPSQVMQPSGWTCFKDELGTVLSALSALPITVAASGITATSSATATASGKEPSGGDVEMTDAGQSAPAPNSTNNVKYLTSSKLFGLQVRISENGSQSEGRFVPGSLAVSFLHVPDAYSSSPL